jgi:uncharacterized OB-fold protein
MEMLTAPYLLEYGYKRSCGPVVGAFLAGLCDKKIFGARAAGGRVLVPPVEYDERGVATSGLVEVGPKGVVRSFTWIAAPRPSHPLPRPFAFALIVLDGADTAMVHAVDAGEPGRIAIGVRVQARFRDQRAGHIRDLECFDVCG